MKKNLFLCFLLGLGHFICDAQLRVQKLTTESLTNPIGIDRITPHLGWQLSAPQRHVLQAAYEVRVGTDPAKWNKATIRWQTGKVLSDQSTGVPYAGEALASGARYYWQVRVWDNQGQVSAWSTPASWQMGLLKATDWKASWIVPSLDEEGPLPSPLFRKVFPITKKIKTATAYITAHGLYEAQLNGQRVGDAYLTPGWTSYNKRLQYQVYDVTALLKAGENAIGVTLGNGWYRGYLAWGNARNHYGKDIALLLQLDITFTDGSTQQVVSDRSWKASTGAIRYSEIYHGETIDARQEKKGWTRAGYDDSQWDPVEAANFSKEVLIATYNEPVKKHETFKPVKIFKTPAGEQVIDYGQNLVGWVVLKATGKAGDTITVSHAEVLDKAGNFYTENLRAARSQNKYVLQGGGEEIFEPHFTWHGFRYLKVEGYTGELKPENFTAVALYSAMQPTGRFTSSHPLLNQLQHNIEWGLKGNFLDVPTDCPQRDERLGWTGDAQVFFRTASFLQGVGNFFDKWLQDLAADQLADGRVPHVIPHVLDKNDGGSAGWADASTIIPWNMYLAYGDKRILEQQYPSMKGWVDYMTSQSTNHLWNKGGHFGDWLFYSVQNDVDGRSAITDKYLIAQCFYAYSTQLLIKTARLLGKTEEVQQYTALLANTRAAFLQEYTTANGATVSNSQTSYVLPLQFDLFPEDLRQQAADRLVKNIRQYGNHLTTGFLGTPYLCHVLSRFGHTDVAYALLLQETYPSWLYPVKMGATTIWERWDGQKPDGSFQTPTMNSFNHYAYGAIGDWMYRVLVGLDTEEAGAGYKKITVKPHIGGALTHAAATYETRYGQLHAGWKLEKDQLLLEVSIPANTTATIYVPAKQAADILESGEPLSAVKGLTVAGNEPGYVLVKVGSGKYLFSTGWPAARN